MREGKMNSMNRPEATISQTAFFNALFYTGSELVKERVLLTEGGVITGFTDVDSVPVDAQRVDCKGYLVTAGLIDLQIAGSGGYLFSSNPTPEALAAITGSILATGTTGFLLALPTNTMEVYHDAFRAVREHPHPAILGLHLEGPFISHAKRGAHARELIRVPTAEIVTELLAEGAGTVRMMTVAPEVCTREVIMALKDHGITVSAGHSNATFREASEGFAAGIETTTHLFNAMSPIHHRDPGLPGAVFNSDTARASIIADGIHVDFTMLTIAKKIMKDRLLLVSDAVEENDRGAYRHVLQPDRYTLPDGTLSGARLTMLDAVKNCVRHAGIDLYEAIRMASLYPAQLIKASDRGLIAPGARADLIMTDSNMDLRGLFFNGKIEFQN
ncbi:MAG: N-acetylglucosamine-6-phosphate deacetylase [Bacteroidales bacterium]|nr:N-acetylglucosamine-6-phosphate deacetylase [Bacteroidales bacterium]